MTDEQEKLLKIFKAQVEKEEKEYFCVNVYTQLLYDSHKTALNMLKEKNKEIEKLKKALARNVANNFTTSMKETAKSKEDLEMLNKGWQIELEKKNKIIDLIINEFYKRVKISKNCYIQKLRGIEDCLKYKNCKECLKQYFERKLKNGN